MLLFLSSLSFIGSASIFLRHTVVRSSTALVCLVVCGALSVMLARCSFVGFAAFGGGEPCFGVDGWW